MEMVLVFSEDSGQVALLSPSRRCPCGYERVGSNVGTERMYASP